MTAASLFIIMGATHGKAPAGFAPLAIGLALVIIHQLGFPSRTYRSIRRAAPGRRCLSAVGHGDSSGCSGLC